MKLPSYCVESVAKLLLPSLLRPCSWKIYI